MRLDKYLKISLIFKTRNSGEKAIEKGNIKVNGQLAKPSLNIKVGDELEISYPLKTIKYLISEIKEKNVSKKDAKEMYKIIGEQKFEL